MENHRKNKTKHKPPLTSLDIKPMKQWSPWSKHGVCRCFQNKPIRDGIFSSATAPASSASSLGPSSSSSWGDQGVNLVISDTFHIGSRGDCDPSSSSSSSFSQKRIHEIQHLSLQTVTKMMGQSTKSLLIWDQNGNDLKSIYRWKNFSSCKSWTRATL